jgi:hypothetical protein
MSESKAVDVLLAKVDAIAILEGVAKDFLASLDPESPDYASSVSAIANHREFLIEREKRNREADIELARTYLRRNGFDPTPLDEGTLLSIAATLHEHAETSDDPEQPPVALPSVDSILLKDEDTGMHVTTDGEVIGYCDLGGAMTVEQVLEQVGERLAFHTARKAGIEAERKAWLEKIAAMYDARINKHARSLAWIEKCYLPLADNYIRGLNAQIEARNKELPEGKKPQPLLKKLDIGLLHIALRAQPEKTDIANQTHAVYELRTASDTSDWKKTVKEWYAKLDAGMNYADALQQLRLLFPFEDAIKQEESVLHSLLPTEVKEALFSENIVFRPAGDLICSIK